MKDQILSGYLKYIIAPSENMRRAPLTVCIRICAVLLVLSIISGCSMKKLAVGQMASLMEDGFPAYMKESDPELVRDAMPANLKLIEAMLETDPENQTLLLLACQGFSAYAFLFIENQNPTRAKNLYQRAKQYGFDLMKRRGLLPEVTYDLDAWDQKLTGAEKADVPAIFWTAFAWGGGIQLDRESPAALADVPLVIRLAEQAAALDPNYWFAGPDTFLGFYHGNVPPPIGGKPDLSRQHFEKALELTGRNFLTVQVLYARSYAVQVQDHTLYKKLLSEVIDSQTDVSPEAALSNAVAREKAKQLINQSNLFF